MAARDAFLHIFEHAGNFAEGVARRAQLELGLSAQEPGMMRQYTERKILMKDLKTVRIFAFFFPFSGRSAGAKAIGWAKLGSERASDGRAVRDRPRQNATGVPPEWPSGHRCIPLVRPQDRLETVRQTLRCPMDGSSDCFPQRCGLLREPDEARPLCGKARPATRPTIRKKHPSGPGGRREGRRPSPTSQRTKRKSEGRAHFSWSCKYETSCAERGGPFAAEPGVGSDHACLNSFPRAAGNPATEAEATNLPRGDEPFGLSSAPPELDHAPLRLPELLSFLRVSGSARVGLNAFLAESFKPCCPSACNAQLGSKSGKWRWPCPPPRRWAERLRHYSPRRRRRMRELKLIHDLLRVAIGTLNWIALGSPLHCPAEDG